MTGRMLLTCDNYGVSRRVAKLLSAAGVGVQMGCPNTRCLCGAKGFQLDLSRVEALEESFIGIDGLLVSFPITPQRHQFARNVSAAAAAAGVGHIVLLSTAGADPASPYDLVRSAGEVEAIIRQARTATTILRPSKVMEAYIVDYAPMLRRGTLCLPHAQAAISYIHSTDVASAASQVLLNPWLYGDGLFTLTGPQAIDHSAAVEQIGAMAGRMIEYRPIDETEANRLRAEQGLDPWLIDQATSIDRFIAAGGAAVVTDCYRQIVGRGPTWFSAFARANASALQ